MPKFKDQTGKEWPVELNVAAVKRVRARLDVDLLQVLGGELIKTLIADPVLLVDILAEVCQAPDPEAFGRAMAGDAIADATAALLEALVSFCPSRKDRANLKQVLEAAERAAEKSRDLVAARIESGELERAIETAVAAAQPPTPGA